MGTRVSMAKAIAETLQRYCYCHFDVPINDTSRISVLPALLTIYYIGV